MGTRRRGSGEGSIHYDQERKRYIGVVNFGQDATGRRIRRKFTEKTKGEVIRRMREAQRAHDEGRAVASANDTVGALLSDFLQYGPPTACKTAKTREGYVWAIEKHLIPGLGARKLRELTSREVAAFLAGKAESGRYGSDPMSKSSLVHLHSVLKRALRWAENEDRIGRNVATHVATPQGKRRTSKALTVEQAQDVIQAAHEDRLEALWCVGLTVPSRPGELTGISWADVDLDAGVIHFRQAVHLSRTNGLTIGTLKTEQSRRSVEVPAFVVEALKRRRAAQAAERLKAGPAWANEHDLVFTTEVGTPIDPANLRRCLRRLVARAGVPGQWTVYELRHSAVSLLSNAGVPIELIADTAGHKNATVTTKVYRHNLATVISSAKAPMEAVFGAAEIAN